MKDFTCINSVDCKKIMCVTLLVTLGLPLVFFILSLIIFFYLEIGVFPEFLQSATDKGRDLINEIELSIAFIASMAAIAIAYITYSQLPPIRETLKMEFIRHLDEQWISPEITRVRCELWAVYWKELKKTNNESASVIIVQKYVEGLHTTAKNNPSKENMEKLFRYLNFVDVMGTIYIYKKKGVLKKEDLKGIYSGKLKRYLDFYKIYFENRCKESLNKINEYKDNVNKNIECKNKPNAMLLLMDMEKD